MSRISTVTGRRGVLTLALAVVAVGVAIIVIAIRAQQSAPTPPRAVGQIDPSPSPSASASPAADSGSKSDKKAKKLERIPIGQRPLAASRPLSISIPSIKVSSQVLPIGLNSDGTLAVPQPGPNLNKAAWFTKSPTPGQPGPAVIEGHVDSTSGPSVFFRLGSVRPGDTIHVTRADKIKLTFTVDAVRDYPKTHFPTEVVYGSKDLIRPSLRLITCSNFDPAIRHHTGNEVVFAHLTKTDRP